MAAGRSDAKRRVGELKNSIVLALEGDDGESDESGFVRAYDRVEARTRGLMTRSRGIFVYCESPSKKQSRRADSQGI